MTIKDVASALINGVISVPVGLYYGSRRTFEDIGFSGRALSKENFAENKRVISVIEKAIKFAQNETGPISQIIRIVIEEFYSDIPDSILYKVAEKAGLGAAYIGTRTVTQAAMVGLISKKLTIKIAQRVVIQYGVRVVIGSAALILSVQGVLEQASNSAHRLRSKNFQLYMKLRQKDLDMAYFLVEDSLNPLVDVLTLKLNDQSQYKRILNEIIEN